MSKLAPRTYEQQRGVRRTTFRTVERPPLRRLQVGRLLGQVAAHLDKTTRGVRVARHKACELGAGRQRLEQATGDATVEGAHHSLALARGVPVGAVAEAVGQLSLRPQLPSGLKAQRHEDLVKLPLGRSGASVGSQVAPDL